MYHHLWFRLKNNIPSHSMFVEVDVTHNWTQAQQTWDALNQQFHMISARPYPH